jgi:putative transposase
MYRRNLPHWLPRHRSVFVTWRLKGTLPRSSTPVVDGVTFRNADRELDKAATGPAWPYDSRIAEAVCRRIEAATERGLCDLHAYVVMPNHVHMLITPAHPLAFVTKWIKGGTAREAHRVPGRRGEPFWQDESFDHWARNAAEFEKIRQYVLLNPVRAGLAAAPDLWPYFSAARAQAASLCHSTG